MKKEVPDSMKQFRLIFGAAFVCATVVAAPAASAQSMTLQQVLSKMDAASAKFQDTEADISVDLYTAVVQEHQTQTGTAAFRRVGDSLEMVTHIKDSNGAAASDLLYKNGELDVYQPAAKTETIVSAGANRAEYDSMLATGFGADSRDLDAAWNVTFEGMEIVGGVETAKLDLVPKDQNIRNNFSHVVIWVDLTRDISLKQSMIQPDGDSRTVTYTNIGYNQHPSAKLFTLHIASGTQIRHQ